MNLTGLNRAEASTASHLMMLLQELGAIQLSDGCRKVITMGFLAHRAEFLGGSMMSMACPGAHSKQHVAH